MFGAWENDSKIFPMLILAQKNKQELDLSNGKQQRDYLFVNDLANFIKEIISEKKLKHIEREIINIASNKPSSIKELSEFLSIQIPKFNPKYWNWGTIQQRDNESDVFYNISEKALSFGLKLTPLGKAFNYTVNHYYKKIYGTDEV